MPNEFIDLLKTLLLPGDSLTLLLLLHGEWHICEGFGRL